MQKRTIIKKIKAIIEKHGIGAEQDKCLTSAEMELESSLCIASLGSTNQLAEIFGLHKVTAITYDKQDEEIDEDYISYEDLTKDILEEILSDLENYEVDQDKFLESCRE